MGSLGELEAKAAAEEAGWKARVADLEKALIAQVGTHKPMYDEHTID